jgi:hypothetical protein
MVKGNKGEWSEFYAFLKLLIDRKVYGADENLNRIDTIVYPITKIIREEGIKKWTYILQEDGGIKVFNDDSEIGSVDSQDIEKYVQKVFDGIKMGDGAFGITEADDLMGLLHVHNLNAGNQTKNDLILQIYDSRTGTEQEVGFSIKSTLGAAATLLNASAATNFVYGISGLNQLDIEEINNIATTSKIRDRLSAVYSKGGTIAYCGMDSEIFMQNLRKINFILPAIFAEALLSFYTGENRTLFEIIKGLGESDLLANAYAFDLKDYEYNVGNVLHAVALGMMPASPWSGLMQAHGGYLIVKENGDIACYNAYNLEDFKMFLLKHTRFETPSSTRHGFGVIYMEGDETRIKLNLQIRFV